MLELDLEVPDRLRGLGARAERQVPYALSLALDRTAEERQEAQRAEMRRAYTIRRPWVLQGVKIPRGGFATKGHLAVTLGIDPARDFLTKLEAGGRKRPRDGGSVVVPQGARRNKADVVPTGERPRSFQFTTGRSSLASRVTVMRGNRGTVMIRYPDGRGYVLQRTARRGRRRIREHERRERPKVARTECDDRRAEIDVQLAELRLARELGSALDAGEVRAAAEEAVRVRGVVTALATEFAPLIAERCRCSLREASAALAW
jgi:hypothetical protein